MLLQALSILRSVGVGTSIQLTVSKCLPSANDSVSDSENSATPVNMSTDSVVIAAASVPGTHSGIIIIIIIIIITFLVCL